MVSNADVDASQRVEPSNRIGVGPYAFIALIYSIAHVWSLMNRGLFWDDWVFWQQDMSVVQKAGEAMGSTWPAAINYLFFYSQAGITFNRFLAFASLLAAALLLFDILRRLPGVSVSTAVWAGVLFSVWPVYQARIALVMVGYGFSVAVFLFAVWLLVVRAPKQEIWVQVCAAALFLVSFHIASLLVLFYAIVPAVLVMTDAPDRWNVRSIAQRLWKRAALLVLPVVYWAITQVWFKPSGLYHDYNELGAGTTGLLGDLARGSVNSTLYALVEAMPGAVRAGFVHVGLKPILLIGGFAALLVVLGMWKWPMREDGSPKWMLHAGLFLIAAAVLPYVIVGKLPSDLGWDTRHQLLVPIGAALLLVALLQPHAVLGRIGRYLTVATLAVVVAVSVGSHFNSYIDFQRDWLKQEALLRKMEQDGSIRSGRFIVFEDKVLDWNQTRVEWVPYQFTGLLAEAYGDQSRLGYPYIRRGTWFDYARARGLFIKQPYYKTGDYQGQGPDRVATITEGSLDLGSGFTVFKLSLLDWIDRERLYRELDKALVVKTKTYRPAYWERKYAPE